MLLKKKKDTQTITGVVRFSSQEFVLFSFSINPIPKIYIYIFLQQIEELPINPNRKYMEKKILMKSQKLN